MYTTTHILVERGLNPKPISGWPVRRLIVWTACLSSDTRGAASSTTDWSRTIRPDVSLPLSSADSLSNFASLGFRWLYPEFPLVGLGLEAHWQVRNELSQTGSGPAAKTDPQV